MKSTNSKRTFHRLNDLQSPTYFSTPTSIPTPPTTIIPTTTTPTNFTLNHLEIKSKLPSISKNTKHSKTLSLYTNPVETPNYNTLSTKNSVTYSNSLIEKNLHHKFSSFDNKPETSEIQFPEKITNLPTSRLPNYNQRHLFLNLKTELDVPRSQDRSLYTTRFTDRFSRKELVSTTEYDPNTEDDFFNTKPVFLIPLTERKENDNNPILFNNLLNNMDFTYNATKDFGKSMHALDLAEERKINVSKNLYNKFSRRQELMNKEDYTPINTDNGLISPSNLQDNFGKNITLIKKQTEFMNSSETVLFDSDTWIEINVSQEQYSRFSIFVKSKPSPLILKIKASVNIDKIKTYVSRNVKNPSKIMCEQEFVGKLLKIYDLNKKSPVFNNTYLYFAIMAYGSGSIKVKFTFEIDDLEKKKKFTRSINFKNSYIRTNQSNKTALEAEIEARKNPHFFKEIMLLKKKKRDKILGLCGGKNKIEINRSPENFDIEYIRTQETLRKLKFQERCKQIVSRKQEIDKDTQIKKVISVMKNDIKKTAKIVDEEKRYRMFIKENLQKFWITLSTLVNLSQSIDSIFKEYKKLRKRRLAITWFTKKLTLDLQHQLLRRKGDSITARNICDLRTALNVVCIYREKHAKNSAFKIFMHILQESSKTHFLFIKLGAVIEKVKKIQKMIRTFWKKKEAFKEIISLKWDRLVPKAIIECRKSNPSLFKDDDIVIDEIKKLEKINKFYENCWETFTQKMENYKANSIVYSEIKRRHTLVSAFKLTDRFKKRSERGASRNNNNNNQFNFITQNDPLNANTAANKSFKRLESVYEDPKNGSIIDINVRKVVEKIQPPKLFYLPNDFMLVTMIKDVIITSNDNNNSNNNTNNNNISVK